MITIPFCWSIESRYAEWAHTADKQHVKVHVEIQCAAKALDQRDRAGMGRIAWGQAGHLDESACDRLIVDVQHFPHHLRLVRKVM